MKEIHSLQNVILQKSSLLKNEIISIRRQFHMYPELSFQETETAKFISDYLDSKKISYKPGIAGTGIIARIDGRKEGNRTIAIRAEMDALPVAENNNTLYKSRNNGKMHACGHDANMAMLLGTAMIVNDLRDYFGGSLLLIFQPGEERSPGGAKLVLESGALNNPKPDFILAQHVLPELETGKIGYKSGRYMASCDEIYITIEGKGGHAALPGLTTDQILIAAHLIIRLKETITGTASERTIPTVLGIGRISGEGATNVIPDKVEIAGTFRTFDENWRNEAQILMKSVCEKTGSDFGVNIRIDIAEGYPVLINDEKLARSAAQLSTILLGSERVEILTDTRMSSDDFSFYSSLAPSLYFRLGIRKKGEAMRKLHTSEFEIDEDSLETGVSNMSWLALNLLSDNYHF